MNSENYYKVAWKSPANIALVKYWGKQGNQLPKNPSISLTLKDSVTTMSMTVKKSSAASLKFFFEKKANEKFQHKISKFLTTQYSRFPWLAHSELEIYSENTFKANTCTTYSFVLRGWTSLKLSTSVLDKILTRDQAVWSIQKERGL